MSRPFVVLTGNYLDPDGVPVLATRLPAPDEPNIVGGYATAHAWVARWVHAAADVTVFTHSDGLQWDHALVRHVLDPGEWVVWTGSAFRVVTKDAFAAYTPVDFEVEALRGDPK